MRIHQTFDVQLAAIIGVFLSSRHGDLGKCSSEENPPENPFTAPGKWQPTKRLDSNPMMELQLRHSSGFSPAVGQQLGRLPISAGDACRDQERNRKANLGRDRSDPT